MFLNMYLAAVNLELQLAVSLELYFPAILFLKSWHYLVTNEEIFDVYDNINRKQSSYKIIDV